LNVSLSNIVAYNIEKDEWQALGIGNTGNYKNKNKNKEEIK